MSNFHPPELILSPIAEVKEMLGQGHTQIYSDVASGDLTPQIKNGKASRWLKHEIQALAAARAAGVSKSDQRELVKRLVALRPRIFDYWNGVIHAAAA